MFLHFFEKIFPVNHLFINACLPNLILLYTIFYVIKKWKFSCSTEPYYYRICEVFHANEKVSEWFYPSIALEGQKFDRWVRED